MTDEFEQLRAALKTAPQPRDGAKTAALDRAMAAFDEIDRAAQDKAAGLRPMPDRPQRTGIAKGVFAMFDIFRGKPALAATTSALALGLAVLVVLPQTGLRPGALPPRGAGPQAEDAATPPATGTVPEGARSGVVYEEDAPGAAADHAPPPAPVPVAPGLRKAAPPEPEARIATADDAMAPAVEAAEMEPAAVLPAPMDEARAAPDTADEAYANAAPHPVRVTGDEPVSTFAADVDTAAYALIRNSLNAGFLPDPQAVRVEEMLNYFPYDYPAPEAAAEAPFRPSLAVMPTPWNPDTRLVRIGLQGIMPALEQRPPLNLVFLIDTSGSMQEANKLPLLRQSLGLMLGALRPEDQIAIVTYAGSAGLVLPATPAGERAQILGALDRLEAGGSTAGAEGLALAYATAATMTAPGEVSRILLATDGDFNVGISDPEGLAAYIARQRDRGVYLSVLGFGRGNLDDATMQSLAQNGNGTASYIDTLQEARKVLIDQLTGTLFPIADDVKIQVEWNPAEVAEYRLIGYETRALRREDFNNDRVDAGEIGAGHQVTALYEITAPGSPALLHDPLRYGTARDAGAATAELGFLRLRYKRPGEGQSALIEMPILAETPADPEARFAAAIAGFGELLRGSVYLGDWGWDQAIALAQSGRGPDPYGYRIEAVNLMRLARDLSR